MISYVFSPENAFIIGGWGFLFGLAGLLLSLFGFALTIYQIRKVKAAAMAAETAIGTLKVRLSHLDIVQECAFAESLLNTLWDAVQLNRAPPVTTKHAFAASLMKIRGSYSDTDPLAGKLDAALQRLSKFPNAQMLEGEQLLERQSSAILRYRQIIGQIRSRIQEDVKL